MKAISACAAGAATLALLAGAGAVGQALATPATGSPPVAKAGMAGHANRPARAAYAGAARPAAGAGPIGYPGYPMITTGTAPGATAPGAPALSTVRSTNWSGFATVRRGVTFRSVRATFYVPYVNCRLTPKSYSSHWVGFDGFKDKTVEQDGFEADCHGSRPFYRAWWELYPKPETRIRLYVAGGDSITAAVSYSRSDGKFTFTISNNTRHRRFRTVRRCQVRCRRSSAEVISEAPTLLTSSGAHLARLADYGAASYENIAITDSGGARGGIVSRHWNFAKIIQVRENTRVVVAQPTSLHGPAFDSYWLRVG
jgi:Peptidase A4 family